MMCWHHTHTASRANSFQYDWLLTQFRDWAYMLVFSFLYYEDYDLSLIHI